MIIEKLYKVHKSKQGTGFHKENQSMKFIEKFKNIFVNLSIIISLMCFSLNKIILYTERTELDT